MRKTFTCPACGSKIENFQWNGIDVFCEQKGQPIVPQAAGEPAPSNGQRSEALGSLGNEPRDVVPKTEEESVIYEDDISRYMLENNVSFPEALLRLFTIPYQDDKRRPAWDIRPEACPHCSGEASNEIRRNLWSAYTSGVSPEQRWRFPSAARVRCSKCRNIVIIGNNQ